MSEATPTRHLTILAQDPTFLDRGDVVTAQIRLPAERLRPGPQGHRVHVIDYDASTDTLYRPRRNGLDGDPYEKVTDPERLTADPAFHAQNLYAIAMATLARFEAALGRRTRWAFFGGGHQLKLVPHAFQEANAFYSRRDEALMFGYFDGRRRNGARRPPPVFTCLSHDIVVHETTHALMDGLRPRYSEPSSPDQAALHEGYADAIALLSVLSIPRVIQVVLRQHGSFHRRELTAQRLRDTALFGLGEQFGRELEGARSEALRASAKLPPSRTYIDSAEFQETYRRGELFVAAMMNAFLHVWLRRLEPFCSLRAHVALERVVEEGATAAQLLLDMAIRAIDYAPPVDIQFGDFLSAMLTADADARPDDTRYAFRPTLRDAFGSYGIQPASGRSGEGRWAPPHKPVSTRHCHFETMQRDTEEMFRFVWENREALELEPSAYTYVSSVRPVYRVGVDGFVTRGTVSEYVQILDLTGSDLRGLGIRKPRDMPASHPVRLYGGGALLFDEFGRLHYHVGSGVRSPKQQRRLEHLWESGALREQGFGARRMARLHRERALSERIPLAEAW